MQEWQICSTGDIEKVLFCLKHRMSSPEPGYAHVCHDQLTTATVLYSAAREKTDKTRCTVLNLAFAALTVSGNAKCAEACEHKTIQWAQRTK